MPKIQLNILKEIPRTHKLRKPHNWTTNTASDLQCDKIIKTTTAQTPQREITELHIWNFRQYLLYMKMNLNISKEEFKKLFALEGEEFKSNAYILLVGKMKIPKELTPGFIYSSEKNNSMFYNYMTNTIAVNPNAAMDKKTFLILLRHELQHCSQNINMFRHETKGKELIEVFSSLSAKSGCKNIDSCVRNIELEQLKTVMDEDNLATMVHLKNLLKHNPEEYKKYLQTMEKELYNTNVEQYTNFRKIIIDRYGILKENSKEGKRAEKMFNETVSETGYWKQDGSAHYGQYYLQDCRENEAMAAQSSMAMNISSAYEDTPKCYMEVLRSEEEKINKGDIEIDSIIEKDIEETMIQINEQGISLKQLMSYLFN